MSGYSIPPPLPPAGGLEERPQKRSRKPLFWGLAGAAVMLAMCGGGFIALMGSRKGLEQPTRAFLKFFQQNEYGKAYDALASKPFKEHEGKEKLIETLEVVAQVLGELKSFEPGAWRIKATTANGTLGYIEYSGEFAKGKGRIVFNLQTEGTEWKINNFQFNSDLFNEYLRDKVVEDKKRKENDETEDNARESADESTDMDEGTE